MDTQNAPVGWSDDQWSRVNRAVADEVNKSSVVGAFLPCFGPLSRSAECVGRSRLFEAETRPPQPLIVDDNGTINFWTLTVQVSLKQQQLAQENLDDALLAFRRAANLLARTEDAIAFLGLPHADPTAAELEARNVPAQCRVTGGELMLGLVAAGDELKIADVTAPYGSNLVRSGRPRNRPSGK